MITVFPEKYKSRATATRPAFGAWIGVPAGLRKSAPPCALRGLPLKMLRVPNALLASCGTGRTNGAVHRRSAADAFQLGRRRGDEGFVDRQPSSAEQARLDDEIVGGARGGRAGGGLHGHRVG